LNVVRMARLRATAAWVLIASVVFTFLLEKNGVLSYNFASKILSSKSLKTKINRFSVAPEVQEGMSISENETGSNKLKKREIIDQFENWAAQSNIKYENLQHGIFDFLGDQFQGLEAKQALSAGTNLITLPKDKTLATFAKEQCPFPAWINPTFWEKQPNYVRLAIKLLWERQLGANSNVEEYVKLLPNPEDFDTLYHWSDAELKSLQYPALEMSVRRQREQWAKLYEQLSSTSSGAGSSFTQTEFVWAMECVLSRAFSGRFGGNQKLIAIQLGAIVVGGVLYFTQDNPLGLVAAIGYALPATIDEIQAILDPEKQKNEMVLLPMIDSLNHQTTVKTNLGFNPLQNTFTISMDKEYRKSEQVFMSYGEKTNDELLQFFGFVEQNNPADTFAFPLSEYVNEEKAALIERQGLGQALRKLEIKTDGSLKDPKLMEALAIAVADEEDLMFDQRVWNGGVDDQKAEKELEEQKKIKKLLHKVCQESIMRIREQVMDEDTFRARLARQFRKEKLALLNKCIVNFKS